MTITLYNILSCPPCNFVRALAKHVGIELKTKNLDAYKNEHYSDEYLKINPFHKAPAIEDDGFVVYESNAIAYYLLRKYAPESELYPACIQTRTRIDQILAAIATTIHNAQIEFTNRPKRFWLMLLKNPTFAICSMRSGNVDASYKGSTNTKIVSAYLCSNAIAYYLISKYAPESQLYPACVETRTRIDQILASIATTIRNALKDFTRPIKLHKRKPTTVEVTNFEEDYVRGMEHLIGDGKFAVGDTFTLADIALTTHIVVALENFADPSRFPRLLCYYERVKRAQPYFEEIYRASINQVDQYFAELKYFYKQQ